MSRSSDLLSLLRSVLSRAVGKPDLELSSLYPVAGGSINTAYHIVTKDKGQWFCKINDNAPFPDLFIRERRGLDLLRRQCIIRIPAEVAYETAGSTQVLILEWIEPHLPTPAFWSLFGEQLAQLHRITPQTSRAIHSNDHAFGLDHDNYMGSLAQSNTPSPTWVDFFMQQRLDPQMRLATEKGYFQPADLRQFQRLYAALPSIFPEEAPSLLHGDLWSGNFLCDDGGRPVLIDPAVYFGHRSMDLGMTTLFGGFEEKFYEAYDYHYPFPANYREQWTVCNLYPLLIHLNLFGKSYMRNILHTIQRF